MKFKLIFQFFLCLMLSPAIHQEAVAQDDTEKAGISPANTVFASQGDVELTLEELYAAFSSIPADLRLRYIRDGEKVDNLVKTILRMRLIAADADRAGFSQDALVRHRMEMAAEKELAEAWVLNIMENAPDGDYEAIANEYYIAHPDDFNSQEMVDVSHILVKIDDRTREEALEVASGLRDELRSDPTLFNAYILEYSEDPAKTSNNGRYPIVQRGEMVKPFEDAAFALQEAGDISEPVETTYGYHLIRLNRKMPPAPVPFEQIKPQMMEQAKKEYLSGVRRRYIQRMIAEPIELNEAAAEEMVKHYFGEDLEMAPGSKE